MPTDPASLKGTMNGLDVQSGFDQLLQDLPPEALEAAKQLMNVSAAPTPQETTDASTRVQAAYAPLLAQLAGQQGPTPQAVPEMPSGLQQFAALLASNIAGTVSPAFARPTQEALAESQAAPARVAEANRIASEKFKTQHAEDALKLSADMTKDELAAAAHAGDSRAASEKALQLARINDALEKRRTGTKIGQQTDADLQKIAAKQKAAVQTRMQIKNFLDSQADKLTDLTPAQRLQLKSQTGFILEALKESTRVDPMSGESAMSPAEAWVQAQDRWNEALDKVRTPKAGGTLTGGTGEGGGLLGGDAAARIKARAQAIDAAKGKK